MACGIKLSVSQAYLVCAENLQTHLPVVTYRFGIGAYQGRRFEVDPGLVLKRGDSW